MSLVPFSFPSLKDLKYNIHTENCRNHRCIIVQWMFSTGICLFHNLNADDIDTCTPEPPSDFFPASHSKMPGAILSRCSPTMLYIFFCGNWDSILIISIYLDNYLFHVGFQTDLHRIIWINLLWFEIFYLSSIILTNYRQCTYLSRYSFKI